jgi:hypothetical protein
MLKRMEVAIFVLLSFELLREPKYKWMHVVWSGFNAAFRSYFPKEDPVLWLQAFFREGLIDLFPAKGGANVRPRFDLLHTLTDEERIMASAQRVYLETVIESRKNQKRPIPSRCAHPHTLEERAEELWIEGHSTEALKLLGYL